MLTCYFDGSCLPVNPGGRMGIGALIKGEKNEILFKHSKFIDENPENSNNVAEYLAFSAILNWLYESRLEDMPVLILGDSQLVVNQMNWKWRIKSGRYFEYAMEASRNLKFLRTEMALDIKIEWIQREENTEADLLSNPERIEYVPNYKTTSFSFTNE